MLQTICTQFVELPGLRLTAKQAQQVWEIHEWTCRRLLETLVERKFLFQNEQWYIRAIDGRSRTPPGAQGRAEKGHAAKDGGLRLPSDAQSAYGLR